MLGAIESRLSDPTYPASKKWIYLLCLPDGLAPDEATAKGLCVREMASSNPFIADSAKQIVDRFWA